MKTIGIVAEYNPFHLGHAWHIRESRRIAAAEEGEETAVIAVMSGDYVQRGEAAVFSKFARAEAACRCGADLVVELPLPWSLSSRICFLVPAGPSPAGPGLFRSVYQIPPSKGNKTSL